MFGGNRNDDIDDTDTDAVPGTAVDVHRRERMKLFIYVTNDKYELPLAVADSVPELARMTGKNPTSIRTALFHVRHGNYKHSCYQEVEVEDD